MRTQQGLTQEEQRQSAAEMAQSEKIFAKADKGRAKKGLPPRRTGFDYAKAIRWIQADHNYELQEIANCIGCAQSNVQAILKDRVPKHITGELLWGLCLDLYGHDGQEAKRLFCDRAQIDGGAVGIARPTKHTI